MPIKPRNPSRIIHNIAAAALAALALVAGASDGASGPVEITIEAQRNFRFQPQQVEVPAGREVVLTLENTTGVTAHNLHIPAFDVKTETIIPGESNSIRFTPTEPGTYEFRCEVPGHAAAGMIGTLKVQ